MSQLQSITILLAIVALAFSPWILQKALSRDGKDAQATREAGALPELLSPVQAAARAMYGEANGYSRANMHHYDHHPWVREPWEAVAKVRLSNEVTVL